MHGELRIPISDAFPPTGASTTRAFDDSDPADISKIRHDIHHELATIMLLADVVRGSKDIGTDSRTRIEQLSCEVRWLEELVRTYDDVADRDTLDQAPPAGPVRVDMIAAEVLAAMRMTSMARVQLRTTPAWTMANPLALWRALRNIVQNAFRAAGQGGRVEVKVSVDADRVFAQIDDDGPGFGLGPNGASSLGLGIVQDFAVDRGGVVEIRDSELGGSCVRLVLPAVDGDAATGVG